MKVRELLEAVNPKLAELVAKYGLTGNKTLTKLDDFPFKAEHKEAFKSAGYRLEWNGKKFDVISDEKDAAASKKSEEDFASRNITHRAPGFKPRRKMK